jgi:hypothetical protein
MFSEISGNGDDTNKGDCAGAIGCYDIPDSITFDGCNDFCTTPSVGVTPTALCANSFLNAPLPLGLWMVLRDV